MATTMAPAWAADLSEEWVDQPAGETSQSSSNNSTSGGDGSIVRVGTVGSALDFGSMVIKESAARPSSVKYQAGTTVFQNALSGSPSMRLAAGGNVNQLAWAVSALQGNKDLIFGNGQDDEPDSNKVVQVQSTPLRLQKLFQAPTPPSATSKDVSTDTKPLIDLDTQILDPQEQLPESQGEELSVRSENGVLKRCHNSPGTSFIALDEEDDENEVRPALDIVEEEDEGGEETGEAVNEEEEGEAAADREPVLSDDDGDNYPEDREDLPEGQDHSDTKILEPRIQPPTADFSFHLPVVASKRASWHAHLQAAFEGTPPLQNPSNPLATSTPTQTVPRAKQSTTASGSKTPKQPEPSPATSLGLFKFQYDTYTRQHLTALVDEFERAQSPPREDARSTSRQAENEEVGDAEWLDSLHGLMRRSALYRPALQAEGEDMEDADGRIASSRSSKRVRLSASELGHSPASDRRRAFPAPHTPSNLNRRSILRSGSARRSGHTPALHSSTPLRPPLRSLPPMSMPASRRTSYRSEALLAKSQPASSVLAPKTPSSNPAVRNRLEEAKALMERIKQRQQDRDWEHQQTIDASERAAQGDLRKSAKGYREPSRLDTMARPANPTPFSAFAGRSHLVPSPIEEESEPDSRIPDEEADVVPVQSDAPQGQIVRKDYGRPQALSPFPSPDAEEERQDALAPLPRFDLQVSASIRQALSLDQIGPNVPSQRSYLQQQSEGGSSAGGPPSPAQAMTKRTFQTAPLSRYPANYQNRGPSMSSQASSDKFYTSTSTYRIVSGASTAATSLIASTINGGKRHGSAALGASYGLVTIGPEAVEHMPSDLLKDMVFDDANKRWVKASSLQQDTAALSPEMQQKSRQPEDSEDDPFRDITGFESSSLSMNYNLSKKNGRTLSLSTSSASLSLGHSRRNSAPASVASLRASQRSFDGSRGEYPTDADNKTSTPPHASSMPIPSPDLPPVMEEEQEQQTPFPPSSRPVSSNNAPVAVSTAPRSVLKSRHKSSNPAYTTPVTRAGSRSVSFSDGKLSGKIANIQISSSGEERRSSGLKEEVLPVLPDDPANRDNTARLQEEEHSDQDDKTVQVTDLNPRTSTTSKSITSNRTQGIAEALDDLDRMMEDDEESSTQSTPQHMTPTGIFATMQSRTRSVRVRPRSLGASVSAIASTSVGGPAWHHKSNLINGNATILTECSFGVSHDRLLQVLTDVVPFEPCWKELKRIDLQNRNVDSTVRLKEFLPRLDELILSNNLLSFVSGIPSSLRMLDIRNNKLSDLTNFSHLHNLEHLDISENPSLTSIAQLSTLVHLRKLSVDGCCVSSIQGIENLDGLVHLSLKGNSVGPRLDLSATQWRRMESLDISDNGLEEVMGLEALISLKAISLDHNRLRDLPITAPAPELRILKISHNMLTHLDLHYLPYLRTLLADCNSLICLTGTSRLRCLENVSMREQLSSPSSVGAARQELVLPVRDLRDIRRLYLSNNPIPTNLFPTENFMNLVYLELASCRITELPSGLSSIVPNCRLLNLDHNFISNFSPIAGMTRLKRLSALGCRVEKVKALLQVLSALPELYLLDLRLNPVTLGFYPPPSDTSVSDPENESPQLESKANDVRFRRSLPDEWLARRSAYRALVMQANHSLRIVDGLRVGSKQRMKAKELIAIYT